MSAHEPTIGSTHAWWVFVPVLVGAAAAYLLRQLDLPEFAEVAGAMVATLVSGMPFYRRSVEQDEDRAVCESPGRMDGPATAITAGRSTIALSIVLGTAAFWLTDIMTSMFGFGSLGFFGEPVPYDATQQYLSASLRGTPLQILAVFLITVWLGHRLRAAARSALTRATELYVAAVLVTNVLFAGLGDRALSSAEIIVPLLNGVLVWLVTVVGCSYARRTQPRFDAMRMAMAP